MWNTLLITMILVLGTAAVAKAGTLQFFEASAGEGNTRVISSLADHLVLDIDYNAGSAEHGGIFGFSDIQIITTGDYTIDSFACQAVDCTSGLQNFGTTLVATGGDTASGEMTALNFGLLTISGTLGDVRLVAGNYIDFASNPQTVDPFTLAAAELIPEPSTVMLLCIGLAGLLFLRLSSAR